MNPLLDLAESVEATANNTVYTFKIRQGVTFHNGKPLTSADVLASFQRYQRIGYDRAILEPVERLEAPDPQTFVITLREPRPTYLEVVSSFGVPIVIIPAENANAPPQQLPPVGTGPFQFVDQVADQQIRIRRYDNYRPDTRYQGLRGFAGYRQACVDTVTFRMGFGASRAEARQVVRHNGILVNGKRVNIPSYEVRPGDVVEVAPKQKEQLRIKAAAEAAAARHVPEWMEVDAKALKGTFKALPQRAELPQTINESLIIELYSK